ncbi:MAG: 4Fe-4S binding protein [Planctomycetes bacterium]|jgi:ferredoxin-type protein NapH|nr:4Fe-4S binding protein [Planctomycetota bacterium]
MSRRRFWVLVLVHVLIGAHIVHWLVTGSSLTPMEPSEAQQTLTEGKINAGFVLFLILITSTLVVGRFFCGWACHVVALQDLAAHWLAKAGLQPRPLRSRLLVLAPWVVAFHMFVWPLVRHWFDYPELPAANWEWHLRTEDLWATFPGPLMAVVTFLVVGFLIVWWLGAKGFCTHGCPYGAFFALADRVAPVRIKVTPSCDACGHCTSVCTSNVRVHEEVAKHGQIVDPGCMKCLDCVSVCPKEALYVGFALPKPFAISQQRIQARSDFRWPEEIALAVIAFGSAEFAFRGSWFHEGVPLLLSVGLGVITAVFALLFWRLLRRREVTFQHTALKQAGTFTRAGRWALLGIGAWLAFTAHTFVVQRYKASLIAQMVAARGEATPAQLQQALATAESTHAIDLVDDPMVGELRGLLLRRLGRHAEAEAQLLAAHAAQGHLQVLEASLSLASYCLDPSRRRYELAAELVRGVLRVHPQHPAAMQMLEAIEARAR